MKRILMLFAPFIMGYLTNCYVYNTFDSSKFPESSKWLCLFGCWCIVAVIYVVTDSTMQYNKKLEERIKELEKK